VTSVRIDDMFSPVHTLEVRHVTKYVQALSNDGEAGHL
jgi:hypothetical protein